MSSQTIHIIGQTAPVKNTDGTETRKLYYAMNKTELEQMRHKAQKENTPIESWYTQTATGNRIIGNNYGFELDKNIPHVKMVTCPICNGLGHNGKYFCPVCNGSGICRPNNEKHWQQWQLENMKNHQNEN